MSEQNTFRPDPQYLVQVRGLKEYFPISTGFAQTTMLKAVDDVSFDIKKGETLGLVGESGCGKTTVGRTMLHLYKPTAGEIWFENHKIEKGPVMNDSAKKRSWCFRIPTRRSTRV